MYFLKDTLAGSDPSDGTGNRVVSLAAEKEKALRKALSGKNRFIIAYSGGVDSALLAAIAKELQGDRARAILLDSPLLPRRQFREARERAVALGIPLTIVPFPILDDPEFRQNRRDRCYRCKKRACRILKDAARDFDTDTVIDGVNTSDLGEFRPGLRACDEEGVGHPYVECDISKENIREMACSRGLPFWNSPSSACLASRIPYGEEITPGKVRTIETGEDLIHSFGVTQVRLRSHGDLARIEVLPAEFSRVLRNREEIAAGLRSAGYHYITLDIEGFRSGSLD